MCIHTNKINGKKYIGQTCQSPPELRWKNGNGYFNSTHFYNAIKKYGWDNFQHEIIAKNLSVDEANSLETKLIKQYNTMNDKYGYNLTSGGNNYVLSEITKQRLSESHKGYKFTEEQRKKISEANKRRVVSDEIRKKISELRIGFKFTDESRKK